MDLPTYTNIWRIEKRLYKLYDFNLPMPLPIVQVGVFLGIFVFWIVLLQLVHVPFQPPWHVLYLVPPGVVTYFVTRPVLEGKRLPELLMSQLRYLVEPRTWCRLTPVYEPERATIRGTVWRRVARTPAAFPTAAARHARRRPRRPRLESPAQLDRVPPRFSPRDDRPAIAPPPNLPESQPVAGPVRADNPVGTTGPVPGAPARVRGPRPLPPAPVRPPPPSSVSPSEKGTPAESRPQAGTTAEPQPRAGTAAESRPVEAPRPAARPAVNGGSGQPSESPSRDVKPGWRRLAYAIKRGPLAQQPLEGHGLTEVTTRAAASFDGSRRIVVLGTAPGVGQTTTALLLGHSLARHRKDRSVAVDANPGRGSLADRSRLESPETLTTLLDGIEGVTGYLGLRAYTSQAGSGLEVIASGDDAAVLTSLEYRDFAAVAAVLNRYYKVSLFDPVAAVAPQVLPLADQLVLVASASPGAGGAVGTSLEWLRRHGYAGLAAASVLVVNGGAAADADHAAASAAGRCREILHIPWDDRLNAKSAVKSKPKTGTTTPAELDAMHQSTRDAYLRLAATLIGGFSGVPDRFRQEVS